MTYADSQHMQRFASRGHPARVLPARRTQLSRSLHRCPTCHNAEINPLSHLTLDTPEARQFWRKHPRMLWLPEREIEYGGESALLSSFQSMTNSAQFDVIFQRETLQVLSAHEDTR